MRNRHGRPFCVVTKTVYRLSGLYEQGLVILQPPKFPCDQMKSSPGTSRFPATSVHDELLWLLGHFGIQVIHQAAQPGLLLPAATGNCPASRGSNRWYFRLHR